MRNSIIFFNNNKNNGFNFVHYDCCESIGSHFAASSNYSNSMYIGIPIQEIDEFFLINDRRNLINYLHLITIAFDIKYSIATEEDIKDIDVSKSGFEANQLVIIKGDVGTTKVVDKNKGEYFVKNTFSNKYFNVTYNAVRYLWYHNYTNMAIIATNIYNTGIIEDPIDIFAIALSYQQGNDRAILPSETIYLDGLLFFRPKAETIADLQRNTPFNTVFFKYPIYFNPIVKIKGSFFEDSESVIEAKDLFGKLVGIEDVNDIPKFMRNNIKLAYDDYLLMKHSYFQIKNHLDSSNLSISKTNPLLLSRDMSTVNIIGVNAMGNSVRLAINIMPLRQEISFTEDPIDMRKENIRKTADKLSEKEMFPNSDPW